jgi:XTP/dITP diphosphohydrolase
LNSKLQELLIATTNAGKVAEIADLLRDLPFRVISLNDLPQLPEAPEETGCTFVENALLKARYYFAATGKLSLADDSGLEVDALQGAPGIHSARYAGEKASDTERIEKLLREMQGVPDEQRTARFRCSVALAGRLNISTAEHVEVTFDGICEGRIIRASRGNFGFGYDPIFEEIELQKTFAELGRAEKALRSHRGQALEQVREYLHTLFTH